MEPRSSEKKRRRGIRLPGITAMARFCGVSHSHMRYVRLGIRVPSRALRERMEEYMSREKQGKGSDNAEAGRQPQGS